MSEQHDTCRGWERAWPPAAPVPSRASPLCPNSRQKPFSLAQGTRRHPARPNPWQNGFVPAAHARPCLCSAPCESYGAYTVRFIPKRPWLQERPTGRRVSLFSGVFKPGDRNARLRSKAALEHSGGLNFTTDGGYFIPSWAGAELGAEERRYRHPLGGRCWSLRRGNRSSGSLGKGPASCEQNPSPRSLHPNGVSTLADIAPDTPASLFSGTRGRLGIPLCPAPPFSRPFPGAAVEAAVIS